MSEDLKRMERALLNAEKAGDVEAAKVIAREMRLLMQRQEPSLGMPDPVRLGSEGMGASVKDAAKDFGTTGKVLAGMGSAPALAYEGVKGLFGQSDPSAVAAWRGVQKASPESLAGNIGGNTLLFGGVLPTQAGAGVVRGGAAAMGARAPAIVSTRPWTVADTAATSTTLNAAAEPGTPQDRAMAGLWALGGSTVFPAAYAVGAGGRRMLTEGGKRVGVGEGLRLELGPEGTERLSTRLRANDPFGHLGVRSSSAVRTGEPVLGTLESGSRATRGDLWRQFDQDNASARWASLQSRAGTPEEVAVMRAEREAATGGMRREAIESANIISGMSGPQAKTLQPLFDKIGELRVGAARPNPDAQKLADYVEAQLKEGVSPDQLYTVRKVLTDGVKAGNNSELSNAIKSARAERMEIVGLIDDALNTLSGGQWGDYLASYAGRSLPINSKEALQKMVADLQRGQPVGDTPAAMNSAYTTIGRLRDRYGQKEIGSRMFDRLLPEDRALINSIVDNLKRQQDAMKSNAVVGSHTAALLANSSRAQNITQGLLGAKAASVIPGGGILAGAAFDNLGRKAEQELARLLQDPDALLEAIRAAERAEILRKSSSLLGGASGAVASQYPR